jgi:ATP-dependent DNA helicase RecG
MLSLNSTIENLEKIQKPQIAALKKLKVHSVQDLLLYFPYRYLDFSKVSSILDLKPDENVSIKATIKNINSRFSFRGRMSLAEAVVSDSTGSIKVTWFNQPYLAKSLKTGDEIFLAGKPNYYNNKLQLTNPIYEKVSDFPIHTSRLVPIYHLNKEIYPKTFRNFIAKVLPLSDKILDSLPPEVLKTQNLMGISETIKQSHFPGDIETFEMAKKRLAFEEIFLNQLAAQKHKLELAAKKTYKVKFDEKLVKKFVDSLPFRLTDEQKKAIWAVLQDLEKPIAMNRLIEGDVGSGKTLVGLIAALEAANQGYQVAFLAPTEILAQQHYTTFQKFLSKTSNTSVESKKYPISPNIHISLLTNSFANVDTTEIKKPKLQNLISEGMPGIFIGTHALLSKPVKFKKLALVIIDEQHRFGVKQRSVLFDKPGKVPHLMSLTATPIPRTLQLAFFGDLDISQIKTKPADRKPITTKLFNELSRTKAYQFISAEIKKGRQAFVITPLIEESEILDVKSAKLEQETLQKIFSNQIVGLLHGKMKAKEKEAVMADFLANKLQILVSTSVVEVGVDVPNASVMVIEGAERFGLAQLHQFRGRVGRAEHQSYCFLFPSSTTPSTQSVATAPILGGEAPHISPVWKSAELLRRIVGVPTEASGQYSPPAKEEYSAKQREVVSDSKNKTLDRLQKFTQTQDGFELAELDLAQRGFGELYGASQSGVNFKYFDPSYTSLIAPAREEAIKILSSDNTLKSHPALWNKIKNQLVHFE